MLTTKNLAFFLHHKLDPTCSFLPGKYKSVLYIYMLAFLWFGLLIYLGGGLFVCCIFHIEMRSIQYLSFSIWYSSLNIIPSRFTHILRNGKISSLQWLSSITLYIHTASSLSIHPPPDGHFCCFPILHMVNNAMMNRGVHIFSQITAFILFGWPRSGKPGLVMMSNFSRVCWPHECLLWKSVYSAPLPSFYWGWFSF